MFRTLWGWATAAIGLAIIALTYLYGMQLGNWADNYAGTNAENASPAVTPLFGVAALGLLLTIGGVVTAATSPRQRRKPPVEHAADA